MIKLKIMKKYLLAWYNVIGDIMAGTITHAYFSDDLYNLFDENKKKKFKDYKNNLRTYGQGHDILYFCYLSNLRLGKYIRQRANYYHKNQTQKFFIDMIKYIKKKNLKGNIDVMSFLYGYIGHYCLDKTVHPYVTYKGGIFKKKNKNTYKYNSKHSEIETYIDCYYMNLREKKDNKKVKFNNFVFNYNNPTTELKELIDYIFFDTYYDQDMSYYFYKSLKTMKRMYRICRYDPYGIKLKIYKFIDVFTSKKIKKLYPVSYAQKLNNDDYYLNLNHRIWYHPRNKREIYYDSFNNLYTQALFETIKIIDAVDEVLDGKQNIKYLDDYFLNISMASGKECHDMTKNKYFEY